MNPAWRTWPLKLRPGGPGGAEVGRWVTPEELNVAPGLLGRPLARPWRRLLAMGADLAAIGIVSSVSNFWLLAACSLGVWERARTKKRGPSPWRTLSLWLLVALMAYAGLQLVIEEFQDSARDRDRVAKTDSIEETEADLALIEDLLTVPAPKASAPQAAASVVEAASAAASIATLQAQVRRLQRQLNQERDAAAEAAAAENWRERLRRFGLDFGVSYGWSLVYFTMLPVWWRGQTLGKRLFGLRIIEITGKPMTPLLSFKRFGGYLAGLGTGGLGLVQLLWDPNRQALQDKAAHTVVIDERLPRRPVPVDTAPAPEPLAATATPEPLPAPDPMP